METLFAPDTLPETSLELLAIPDHVPEASPELLTAPETVPEASNNQLLFTTLVKYFCSIEKSNFLGQPGKADFRYRVGTDDEMYYLTTEIISSEEGGLCYELTLREIDVHKTTNKTGDWTVGKYVAGISVEPSEAITTYWNDKSENGSRFTDTELFDFIVTYQLLELMERFEKVRTGQEI